MLQCFYVVEHVRVKVLHTTWCEPREGVGASYKVNLMSFDSGCHALIEMTLGLSKHSKY